MRKTTYFSLTIASLGLVGLLGAGCGSDTTTPGSSTSNVISSLPKATGAVTGSSSAGALAATTGTKLKDVDDSSIWTGGGKSRPMCELATMTREILREASSSDRTLCYIGKMQSLNKFSGTLDDGNYKYYTLSFDGTPTMRVKFKIVKDSATGSVTNYEMFTCNSSNGGTSYTQNEYLSQVLTSTTATITSKYVGSESSGGTTFTFGSQVSVTGAIDSTLAWTSKTIEAARTFAYDGSGSNDGAFNQKLTLTQGPTSLILDGYNNASFYNSGKAGGAGTSTFSMRLYGKTQLLGASAMPTFAFGDGSAKAIMTFDSGDVSGAGLGVAATAHWTGDDRATAGTSDHAAAVASGTPRADDGTVSVSFAGGQTWNCTDTGSDSFTTATVSQTDMATIQTCDDTYGFGSGEQGGANACYAMP